MKQPISKKPRGPSELGKTYGTNWNNRSLGTDGPVLCEICGTNHPERKTETYIISRFLSYQVVEECCGAIIDQVYKESGEEFATAFLKEFSQDPTNSRFHLFVGTLKCALTIAERKSAEIQKQMQQLLIKASSITEMEKA